MASVELQYGIQEDVIREIRALAAEYELEEVILFGSRARGDYHGSSDIDLAVRGGDAVCFTLDVDEKTTTLLKYDVVNLDGSVQEELLESIRKDGKQLYVKKRGSSMKKYENFCASLKNLQDIYQYEEPYSNVVLTGLVGLYEICFEQSWKAMKEIMEQNGVPEGQTGSPRQILKTAYQMGMIRDEKMWLNALVTRNNVAHAYNQSVALDIVRQTKENYYAMFQALKEEVDQNWLTE